VAIACFVARHTLSSPLSPYTTLFRSVRIISARRIAKSAHFDPRSMEEGRGAFLLVHREKETFTIVLDDGLRSGEVLRWTVLRELDRKSTRLNSSHVKISYAVFCLKKK